MFKINLDDYKTSKIYFKLFDVLLKDIPIKKEEYLISNNITPSSYRLSRKTEQNIGKKIVEKLAKLHDLYVLTIDEINDIDVILNKIYLDMYYKINEQYDEYMKYIDDLLNKKTLLFPILNLFKLFLITNKNQSPTTAFESYLKLFNNVKRYKDFFNNTTLAVFKILELFYDESISEEKWNQEYENAMSYQILGAKCYRKNKYLESLFYCSKAQEMLLKDSNFTRYIAIERTVMNCLNHVGNYELAYKKAIKQSLIVKSLNYSEYEKNIIDDFICTSLLGLKRYSEIIEMIKNNEIFSRTQFTCLLTSLYIIDVKMFDDYIKENIDYDLFDAEECEYTKALINYLKNKDKKQYAILEKHSLMTSIFKIIKNI